MLTNPWLNSQLQNEEGNTVWQNTHRHPNSSDLDRTVQSNYNSKIIYLAKNTELITQQNKTIKSKYIPAGRLCS